MADKGSKAGICSLPVSRVKTIMKSSPDVSCIGQESLFLITKATEQFVGELALMAMAQGNSKQNVSYNDLADIVDTTEPLMFLQDIIPRKIKAKDYYAMLGRKMPGQAENGAVAEERDKQDDDDDDVELVEDSS